MITLAYGRKKPQNGDSGSIFWAALAANVVLDDAHTHNGTDSARLSGGDIQATTVELTNTGWTADGDRYWKLATLPGTFQFDNVMMRFLYNGGTYDGEELFPTTDKQTANTFRVYMPVNNQAVDIQVK
jgi:hypothetical protein